MDLYFLPEVSVFTCQNSLLFTVVAARPHSKSCQIEVYRFFRWSCICLNTDLYFLPDVAVFACQKSLLLTVGAARSHSNMPQMKVYCSIRWSCICLKGACIFSARCSCICLSKFTVPLNCGCKTTFQDASDKTASGRTVLAHFLPSWEQALNIPHLVLRCTL